MSGGGLEFVAQVLSHTYHPDAATRSQSEDTLKQLESQPGYASSLLQLAVLPDSQVPVTVKQAAILRLKNNVKHYWDIKVWETRKEAEKMLAARNSGLDTSLSSPHSNPLTEHDRAIIKDNLYESIVRTPPIIRVQLLECVLAIARVDLPHDWSSLNPSIIAGLSSHDTHRVYCSLLILLKVVSKWEFTKATVRAEPIAEIVATMFPLLLSVLKTVSASDSAEAYEMTHIVCKIVYKTVAVSIPVNLRTSQAFMPWFNEILAVLNRPVNPQQLASLTEKRKHPLWKAKKWASHLVLSLFSRFGVEKEVKVEGNKVFSRLWRGKCVKPAMSALLQLLHAHINGQFVSPIVRYYSFEYLRLTLKLLDLRKLMQSNLQWLISDCIINELSMTHDDIRLFINDPHEFIRRANDLLEEYSDPRTPASRLLIDLCTLDAKRRNNEALKLTMDTIITAMTNKQSQPMNETAILRKEGAMRMLMFLRPLVISENQEALRTVVQPIIQHHCVIELDSQLGFMKSRALDVMGTYHGLEWTDGDAHVSAVTKVCNCLSPTESLPVRLAAIAAVSRLIKNPDILEFVAPAVPALMDACFTLIDEVGNEEVIEIMTVLFEKLGARLIPYVTSLVCKLSQLILTLASEDSSDDESALACCTAISMLATVVSSLADRSELDDEDMEVPVLSDEARRQTMLTLEPHLLTVISRILDTNDPLFEFYEDLIMLLNSILYTDKRVTPALWSVLPRIIEAYISEQRDIIQPVASLMDCMTAYGGETFRANSVCLSLQHCQAPTVVPVSPLDHVLKLVALILTRDDVWGDDNIHKQYACRMLESVLAHHRGSVDHVVQSFLPLLCHTLVTGGHKTDVAPLKLTVLDVIAGVTIYNPSLLLLTLTQAGGEDSLRDLFNVWISYANDQSMDSSEYHQRMTILGMSSLLSLPFAQLPPILTQSVHTIVTLQIQRLAKLKLLYEQMEAMSEGAFDDDDDLLELGDYRGNQWDEGDDIDDGLDGGFDDDEKQAAMAAMTGEEPNEADDKHWEALAKSYEQDTVDDSHYDSPLDQLDPFTIFVQQLQSLQQREADFYSKFMASVSKEPKVSEALALVMAEAGERQRADDDDDAKEHADKAAH